MANMPMTKIQVHTFLSSPRDILISLFHSPKDIIPGLGPQESADLGLTGRRDPDALPPSNFFEMVMSWLYQGFMSLMSGNSLFAIKAGVLTSKHPK